MIWVYLFIAFLLGVLMTCTTAAVAVRIVLRNPKMMARHIMPLLTGHKR